MTDAKKDLNDLLDVISDSSKRGSSSNPRRTASLVLTALAAVCCFNISHANAQQQSHSHPQGQQAPMDPADKTA